MQFDSSKLPSQEKQTFPCGCPKVYESGFEKHRVECSGRQPSEAWEGKLSKIVKEQETFRASWGAFCIELRDFIRQKIAEAREDERNNTTGPGRTYQNGFEAGLAQGKEEGIRSSEGYLAIKKSFYEDGKQDALKKCLEVIEKENERIAMLPIFPGGALERKKAFQLEVLSDFKQQITSLLGKV